ncbi:hypothetical protein B0T09DRAFT_326601 [Sordaria sp. MPI-SDFR-AT-0083]|nr:hypothetical protein B0T09DRAFT_326601 [Sordaria sp. MPI-SDFR-AT-0083]
MQSYVMPSPSSFTATIWPGLALAAVSDGAIHLEIGVVLSTAISFRRQAFIQPLRLVYTARRSSFVLESRISSAERQSMREKDRNDKNLVD